MPIWQLGGSHPLDSKVGPGAASVLDLALLPQVRTLAERLQVDITTGLHHSEIKGVCIACDLWIKGITALLNAELLKWKCDL